MAKEKSAMIFPETLDIAIPETLGSKIAQILKAQKVMVLGLTAGICMVVLAGVWAYPPAFGMGAKNAKQQENMPGEIKDDGNFRDKIIGRMPDNYADLAADNQSLGQKQPSATQETKDAQNTQKTWAADKAGTAVKCIPVAAFYLSGLIPHADTRRSTDAANSFYPSAPFPQKSDIKRMPADSVYPSAPVSRTAGNGYTSPIRFNNVKDATEPAPGNDKQNPPAARKTSAVINTDSK